MFRNSPPAEIAPPCLNSFTVFSQQPKVSSQWSKTEISQSVVTKTSTANGQSPERCLDHIWLYHHWLGEDTARPELHRWQWCVASFPGLPTPFSFFGLNWQHYCQRKPKNVKCGRPGNKVKWCVLEWLSCLKLCLYLQNMSAWFFSLLLLLLLLSSSLLLVGVEVEGTDTSLSLSSLEVLLTSRWTSLVGSVRMKLRHSYVRWPATKQLKTRGSAIGLRFPIKNGQQTNNMKG